MATAKKRAVIVRAYSGVFFGYLAGKKGDTCTLTDARQIWSWNSAGLDKPVNTCGDIALRGVGTGSKVSDASPRVEIEHVRATFDCSPAAAKLLSSQGWGGKK
jgi:hypothetical protein